MNIEDWLHHDARRETDNPLEARIGGLVDRVRGRRRRRAATQAAGAVTVVAAGLVAWQVGGPWERSAPPPATDPPETVSTEDPTEEPTEEPIESPDDSAETEISTPESYEPACGQAWQPPTAYTGWEVTTDLDSGPYQASPDGSSGGLTTELTLTNTSGEDLTADTYTQVVLVQDGTVVSPAILGSDHVVDTSLASGEETTQSGGHQLWDVCDDSWTGVGPSVPAGEYEVYVLLLDAGPYWDNGERAVLAVTEGQTIEVTE